MKTKLITTLVCITGLAGCVWPGIDNRKQGPWDHRDIKTPDDNVQSSSGSNAVLFYGGQPGHDGGSTNLSFRSQMLDSAKQRVRDALIERDSHIVDLEVVWKNLVTDFGPDNAYQAVVGVWNELTGGAPLAHAYDVFWIKDRGAHVQSVAWLIQFKDQWSN